MTLLLRSLGNKVIYDAHECLPEDILCKLYIPRRLRFFIARAADKFEKRASSFFTGVVAATPAIAKRFTRVNSNAVVVSNFPELREFTPVRDAGESRRPWVVFAGVIAERRGIFAMVEAMGRLPGEINATLKLAGTFENSN